MKSYLIYLAALAPLVSGITFTGDAERDFVTALSRNDFPVITTEDPSGRPDVGVPSQVGNDVSGWDIDRIYWQYNPDSDILAIGIDCYVVCGDADGDGNPDRASTNLEDIGGEDTADLSGSESFAISIDWTINSRNTNNFEPQTIIGIPGGNPAGSSTPLNCATSGADAFSMASCFGIYQHAGLSNSVAPAFQFLRSLPYSTANRNPNPSSARPDLEWTLSGVENVKQDFGAPFIQDRGEEWGIDINGFAGSFVDAGIGEDYIPDQFGSVPVDFPCVRFDACDVCLGDGSSCVDCAGIPNGGNTFDQCGECGGDGSSCADCRGVPNGNAQYDECGVCNGDGTTCIPDCNGTPGGRARYDVCDVCDGDNRSCRDCLGVPFGTAVYDQCDICDGDGSSCLDCAGVPFGLAQVDECGICGGDGSSCREVPLNYFGQPINDPAASKRVIKAEEEQLDRIMERMLNKAPELNIKAQERTRDADQNRILSSRGHQPPQGRNANVDVEYLVARDEVNEMRENRRRHH